MDFTKAWKSCDKDLFQSTMMKITIKGGNFNVFTRNEWIESWVTWFKFRSPVCNFSFTLKSFFKHDDRKKKKVKVIKLTFKHENKTWILRFNFVVILTAADFHKLIGCFSSADEQKTELKTLQVHQNHGNLLHQQLQQKQFKIFQRWHPLSSVDAASAL